MLYFPLYKMNISTKEVDYNTKWVIAVAELTDGKVGPTDPKAISWTNNPDTIEFMSGEGKTHWFIYPSYVRNAFEEIGTLFLPRLEGYNSDIGPYFGMKAHKRKYSLISGNVPFKSDGMPTVYETYGDLVAKNNATQEQMTKPYYPRTFNSIFGKEQLVYEGYSSTSMSYWGSYVNNNIALGHFLPSGYAWLNPSNGRYLTRINSECKVYDSKGTQISRYNCFMGSAYTADFLAVKRGTLQNGRITYNTEVSIPKIKAFDSICNILPDPESKNILPWDTSEFFMYNVRSDQYSCYTYHDAFRSYDASFKKLGEYSYNRYYFELLVNAEPKASIYWNGEYSENPIVKAGGQSYVHSAAYVWNGSSFEQWWKRNPLEPYPKI